MDIALERSTCARVPEVGGVSRGSQSRVGRGFPPSGVEPPPPSDSLFAPSTVPLRSSIAAARTGAANRVINNHGPMEWVTERSGQVLSQRCASVQAGGGHRILAPDAVTAFKSSCRQRSHPYGSVLAQSPTRLSRSGGDCRLVTTLDPARTSISLAPAWPARALLVLVCVGTSPLAC